MAVFRNIRLSFKMALGFSILLAFLVLVGAVASWTMRQNAATARAMVIQDTPALQITNQLSDAYAAFWLNVRSYALSGNPTYSDQATQAEGDFRAILNKGIRLAAANSEMKSFADRLAQINDSLGDVDEGIQETRQAWDMLGNGKSPRKGGVQLSQALISMAQAEQKTPTGSESAKTLLKMALTVGDVRAFTLHAQMEHDMQAFADADRALAQVALQLENLKPSLAEPDAAKQLESTQSTLQHYWHANTEIVVGLIALDTASDHRSKACQAMESEIDALAQDARQRAADRADTMSVSLAAATSGIVGGTACALLAGILLAVVMTRNIVKPINRAIASLEASAGQTSAAAMQVASSSQSLAQGASEQAASLQETGASLEEMSAMARKNAENAQLATRLSGETKTTADIGDQAMSRMAAAINGIEKAATETAKIVRTIDEIAFQTNLLALNAAVEAARAGEAGKGFAVVADEVRNLAMRSAEAAKNTSSLIDQSMNSAKSGVSIAHEVGKALSDIQGSVVKVNDLIAQIAHAGKEQNDGIGQVNESVHQMDRVTQCNAASAEESAAAAEQLTSQSLQLRSVVTELVRLISGGREADSMQENSQASRGSLRNPTNKSAAETDPDFSDFNVAR
jgi:methyl-accepting chemotaxis protein